MTDFNKKVVAGADDGQATTGGSYFGNADDFLYLGDTSGFDMASFARFTSVTIPPGVTIQSAIIRFNAQVSNSSGGCNVTVHFEDADNAVAITSGSDMVGRPRTSAVNWSSISSWTIDNSYDTPDLKTILQDVIDRGGWASGNAITVHLRDNSSSTNGLRRPKTYNQSTVNCPELRVTYTNDKEVDESESVEISETVTVELEELIDPVTDEEITLSESVAAVISAPSGEILELDNLTVTESVDAEIGVGDVNVSESLEISESASISFVLNFGGFEPIELSESVAAKLDIVADTLDEQIEIGDSISAFNWSTWFAANKNKAIPRYYCTLTGASDGTTDIVIPISSLQARKRTGNPTYVSVVVPGFDYAQQISDRSSGELVIELGYEIDGTIEFQEEILRATLEEIRTDEGAVNRAISLSGNKTETFSTQIVTLENSIYRSLQSGNIVHRFASIDPYLNPGDTCRIGSDEFTVDYIVYMVNSFQTIMEVREG